jgi:hypothetical protein
MNIINDKVDIPLYPGYKLTKEFEIIGKKGYPLAICGHTHKYVNVYVNNKTAILYIYRAIALVYVDGYFDGAWVDHIDNNPLNNHPSNLRWTTPLENNWYYKKSKIPNKEESLLNKINMYKNQIQICKNKIINLESQLKEAQRLCLE